MKGRLPTATTLSARCVWSVLAAAALIAAQEAAAAFSRPSVQEQPEKANPSPSGDATADGQTGKKPERTLDLSSPRATMRAFLLAVQDADGEHPERIDDAVKCLDTSQLEGEDRAERARLFARRLHSLIDKRGVTLDDIPEPSEGSVEYVFYKLPPEAGGSTQAEPVEAPGITLRRNALSGEWLFTAQTLASIPALESAVVDKTEAQKPVESAIPAARRSPRATVRTFLEAMNAKPPDIESAVLCLNPTGRDPEAWSVVGRELAVTLKTVMDKTKAAVLSEIPDAPDGPPYVWHTSKTGNIVIARIDVAPAETKDGRFALQKGEWRFTPQTLNALSSLYREAEDKEIVRELREAGVSEQLTFKQRLERLMPDWLRAELWDLQGWQWVALAVLLPAGWLIQRLGAAFVALLLRVWLRHSKLDIDQTARRRVAGSTGAALTVLFWLFTIQYLGLPEGLLAFLLRATRLALGVAAVWVGYRFVDIVGGRIAANKEVQLTRFDDVLIPLLQKILRLVVVLVVVLFIVEWMGKKWTTLIGALGIGGVALAFAAQDTIGNFFGSITVLFDRPFGIGDWIVIGDVEGTVERVGFRSTRVRTFYNSMVTIPNSKMVNTQVDNYGARRYRRVKVMLSVTYSTPPERIEAFCEGIRELIRLHPYTRKDYYHVYFNQFAGSSLDILLYAFFEVPDWGTELRERHRLFVDILRLADRLGVEFAFPTRTVWLERSRAAPSTAGAALVPGKGDPDTVGLEEAVKVFEESYGAVSVSRPPVVIETTPRSRRAREAGANGGAGKKPQ